MTYPAPKTEDRPRLRPEHDCPPCVDCGGRVGIPMECHRDRHRGGRDARLFCPACGMGWVGTDAEVAQAWKVQAAWERVERRDADGQVASLHADARFRLEEVATLREGNAGLAERVVSLMAEVQGERINATKRLRQVEELADLCKQVADWLSTTGAKGLRESFKPWMKRYRKAVKR